MSWLWGGSSEEESDRAPERALPKEEITYSNAFQADKSEGASTEFGSAFSDGDSFGASTNGIGNSSGEFGTPSDEFFSNTPSASFLPPVDPNELGNVTSGAYGPRVNFDAMGNINAGTVAPAFGIYNRPLNRGSGGVEYVFSDDYMEIRRKTMGEQLQYLTGAAFLSGAFVGGAYGMYEGLRNSAGKTSKLRLNAVLNATAKRGVAASNGLAVIALLFTFAESGIYQFMSDDTAVNYAMAGGATGALYKCTRGLRVAGIWGAAGAATALATVYMARQGKYGRGLRGLL